MFDLVAANALPQCLHTFRLESSLVSIKENIICMHNNKELKSQTIMASFNSDSLALFMAVVPILIAISTSFS